MSYDKAIPWTASASERSKIETIFSFKILYSLKKDPWLSIFVWFLLSNKSLSLDIKACSIKIDFQQIQNLSNFLHYRKNQGLNFIYSSFFFSPVFIPASPCFSFFLVFIKKSFKRMVIFHGGIVKWR